MALEGSSFHATTVRPPQGRPLLRRATSRLVAFGVLASCAQSACTLISPSDGTYLGGVAAGGKAGNGGSGGSQNGGGSVGTSGGSAASAGTGGNAGGTSATYAAFDVLAGGAIVPAQYQIKFVIDTKPLIQSGALDAACANVVVRGNEAAGCDAVLPSWVSPESCGTTTTEIWARVPLLNFGTTTRFVLQFGEAPAHVFTPGEVFDFFDGFDGATLDGKAWLSLPTGNDTISVKGGELVSTGAAAIQSIAKLLSAGQNVYGVRIQVTFNGAEPELAGGALSSTPLPSAQRGWNGLGIKSDLNGSEGTLPANVANCSGDANGLSLQAWANGSSPRYQVAEFGYEQTGGKSTATLKSSRGISSTWPVNMACSTPNTLPILIVMDDTTGAPDPTQRIDYVYVRKNTKSPPTVTPKGVSSGLDCGKVN